MKLFLASIALISAATVTSGQDLTPVDVCRIYGERAAVIVQARYDGLTYLDALQRYGQGEFDQITAYIYRRPMMPTPALAAVELQEVQSAVQLACMDSADLK